MFKDYYKILGLERTASASEIKSAYYRFARIFHPDTSGGNPAADLARFNEITEAYRVLGNLDNRLDYHLMLYEMDEIKEEALRQFNEKKSKGKKNRGNHD